jgi:phosphatidylglycerophosphate synthase
MSAPDSLFARSRKPQPATELLCERLFRPLAHVVVLALRPLRVPPPFVVLAAAATGGAAAFELGRGRLLTAALLLQAKTILDNADGQLARATGRVTVLGRYLDSEADLLVNAGLFAALGYLTDRPLLAAAGFVALTLVVGANFNLKHLYRRERGEPSELMPAARGAAAVLAWIYRVVYAPQDAAFERAIEWRLRRLGADRRTRLAYHDRATLALLANVGGVSTQLAAFGALLALGGPAVECWLALGCAALVVVLSIRRERAARRVAVGAVPLLATE